MMRNATNRRQSAADEPLLMLRSLGKDFVERRQFAGAKKTVCAFDEVDLTLGRGTTLGIVGESGAGKSTLAACIALLEEPTRGKIWFEGTNVASLPKHDFNLLRTKIQMVFQDPASALNPAMTAEQIVAEPLVIQGQGTQSDQRQRVRDLLRQVGLAAESASKRAFEFSGGQKQRLVIARALALQPKLIVLDEACSGLDLKTQRTILDLLKDLQSRLGISLIYISHDLRVVADFADEVAVMYRGVIVEQSSPSDLMSHPLNAYTRDLIAAMPSVEEIYEQRLAGASR